MAFLKRSSKKPGRASLDLDEDDDEESSNRQGLQFNLTNSMPAVPDREVHMLKRKSFSSSHLAAGLIATPSTSFPLPTTTAVASTPPNSPSMEDKKVKKMFNSLTKSLKRSFSGKPHQVPFHKKILTKNATTNCRLLHIVLVRDATQPQQTTS